MQISSAHVFEGARYRCAITLSSSHYHSIAYNYDYDNDSIPTPSAADLEKLQTCHTVVNTLVTFHIILALLAVASFICSIVHSVFCCSSVCCGRYMQTQAVNYFPSAQNRSVVKTDAENGNIQGWDATSLCLRTVKGRSKSATSWKIGSCIKTLQAQHLQLRLQPSTMELNYDFYAKCGFTYTIWLYLFPVPFCFIFYLLLWQNRTVSSNFMPICDHLNVNFEFILKLRDAKFVWIRNI